MRGLCNCDVGWTGLDVTGTAGGGSGSRLQYFLVGRLADIESEL